MVSGGEEFYVLLQYTLLDLLSFVTGEKEIMLSFCTSTRVF